MIPESTSRPNSSEASLPQKTIPRLMPIHPSMRSRQNLIGMLFFNFCKKTTVHGINHLLQVKNFRGRMFWILIVSAAALGFTVNLFQIVHKYSQYQVLSNTYHDHLPFEFPDMSICNLNPIFVPPTNTSHYKNLINWIYEFKKIKTNIGMASSYLQSFADFLYIQRRPYNQPGWSFIVNCKYQARTCTHRDFKKIMMWPYGTCYTFNPFSMNMSRLVINSVIYKGYRPNLELLLYKSIDYPPELTQDPHSLLSMPSGILFMMHEPQSHPYIFEGYLLDFFSVVDIGITRKFHEPRLKECISTRKNYSYIDPVTNVSRVFLGRWADCLYDIIQKEIVKSCGCYFETYPIAEDMTNFDFCKSPTLNMTFAFMNKCLSSAYEKIFANESNMKHCYQDLCTHSSITTVISQAKYPAVEERNSEMLWLKKLSEMEENDLKMFGSSNLATKVLHNNNGNLTLRQALSLRRKDLLNTDFVNRNFMLLRVVAQSLFMDKVEEIEEYPISRLLSDIGGCVGLWLGASLITIFELFDLILDSADIFCNNPYYRYKVMHKRILKAPQQKSGRSKTKALKARELSDLETINKWKDSCNNKHEGKTCLEQFPQTVSDVKEDCQEDNGNIILAGTPVWSRCNLISSV